MWSSLAAAGAAIFFVLSHASDVPVVQISNGTVQGSRSGIVDSFLGIPFAQPPVGELRFRPPLPFNASFGTLNATDLPRACPQLPQDVDQRTYQQIPGDDFAPYSIFTADPSDAGEDCLTLNVQRPAAATVDSKLPVLFWIYGGGFNTGSTQAYDWAAFVAESVSIGHPILVVQANYRLQAFGFLGGSEGM
jgi:carboxylesterase type B